MEKYRKWLGAYGENLACQFLQKRGYTIILRNFSSRYGELDIIAFHPSEPETLCCIEVKTRTTNNFGAPEEAITRTKIKKLHDTACSYFFQNNIEGKIFRLDVIAITVNMKIKRARIKHLKAI
ncbi:MAG: YraN family protein [Candidatus Jacksonbacteria bacterium]|nr:YraN family protein [Candidatus Jacksonbacteria bacterium]